MIKTVVREHHFTPNVIDALFVDAQDHHGIEWLNDDIEQMYKEIKAQSPTPISKK